MRLAVFLWLLLASAAQAHDSRPLAIVIEERAEGRGAYRWTAPGSIAPENRPAVVVGGCKEIGRAIAAADGLSGYGTFECAPGLEGLALGIDYPSANPSISTLVRLTRADGEVITDVLGPDIQEWQAPPTATFGGVAKSYVILGVKHILIGIDHVLFLFGLLLLARTPARVLVTVTGFTVAHSITLALVALDLVRVSVPAVETLIALSIVFVAAELARGDRQSLAARQPVLIASCFGLLHGAGFASVLGEIGLPQTEKVAALLFFNVGVEAGQVLLIAGAFAAAAALRVFRRLAPGAPLVPTGIERLAAYGLGGVSAFWFFGRAATVFS
jgi:hydrogenase/urease accessory protein HupE